MADSPASVLVSVNGEIVRIGTEGNNVNVSVRDQLQIDVLERILSTLQKIERHLEIMTETGHDESEGDQ